MNSQLNITKDEIKSQILNRSLTLTDVIDVVCELNGFVGVGYITFADQIRDYIRDKSKTRISRERLMSE